MLKLNVLIYSFEEAFGATRIVLDSQLFGLDFLGPDRFPPIINSLNKSCKHPAIGSAMKAVNSPPREALRSTTIKTIKGLILIALP